MKMHVPILGGRSTVEIEGDFKEIVKQAAFWSELPDACPRCNSPLHLTFRNATSKDNKQIAYYGLQCENPQFTERHQNSFGLREDGSGFFYKAQEKVTNPYDNSTSYVSNWKTYAEIKNASNQAPQQNGSQYPQNFQAPPQFQAPVPQQFAASAPNNAPPFQPAPQQWGNQQAPQTQNFGPPPGFAPAPQQNWENQVPQQQPQGNPVPNGEVPKF